MNDDQFEALDNRAKTAASSVQAAAQRRRRPAFDADLPMSLPTLAAAGQSRAPRRTAWVAAAAVVALAVGAVTFTTTRADEGKDTTVAAAPVEYPRPFVSDDLPDRLKPLVFGEMNGTFDDPPPSAMPVFGTTVEQPMAAATVVSEHDFENLPLTSFDVDGLTFYRKQDEASLPGDWVGLKQDGAFILVFGATEDDALALARIVSAVDGGVLIDVEQLPDGWRRLMTVDDPAELVYGGGTRTFSSYVAGYYAEDGDGWIQISSAVGNEPGMWAGRLFTTDSREVVVSGHRGYFGSFLVPNDVDGIVGPPHTLRTMAWVERPGEVITVSGLAVSEEELLAAAESVRPAAEREWAELVEKAKLGELGQIWGSDEELGRTTGTFGDGTKWSLSVKESSSSEERPEGMTVDGGVYTELRVAVASEDSSKSRRYDSTRSRGEGAFRWVETTDLGSRYFTSGVISDDVARVELRRSDDSALGDATIVEVAGYRVFVTELTEDPMLLVALGDDGTELGRVTIEDLTVSIDGD